MLAQSLLSTLLLIGQTAPYVERGHQVEEAYRTYSMKLTKYMLLLRETLEHEAKDLLPELSENPRNEVIYGYQLLPQLEATDRKSVAKRKTEAHSYSWPNTQQYITGEEIKILNGSDALKEDQGGGERRRTLERLVEEFQALLQNQKTIDQYVQYNKFWQGMIDQDRNRYDKMTRIYELVTKRQRLRDETPGANLELSDVEEILEAVLGRPELPSFVDITKPTAETVLLRMPIYTDIDDDKFLGAAKKAIENIWSVSEEGMTYSVEVRFLKKTPEELYKTAASPKRGEHIDIGEHVKRFPKDGAVLTTGAMSTYAYVGRYIAISSLALPDRVLAHEFGHLLGFGDSYYRGYRDLGEDGLEILEFVPSFEDLMAAPRDGFVKPSHFKVLLR